MGNGDLRLRIHTPFYFRCASLGAFIAGKVMFTGHSLYVILDGEETVLLLR